MDLVQAKLLTEKGADVIRSQDYRTLKHSEDLEFYHRVKENGYSLEGKEIPTITTIHGSKGRQAPSVVVFDETGAKCFDDPDSEHRLAYVASTRTQGELQICAERTVEWAHRRYDYPVPKEAPHDPF
jgi:superfamily I DNA/RNA helicase